MFFIALWEKNCGTYVLFSVAVDRAAAIWHLQECKTLICLSLMADKTVDSLRVPTSFSGLSPNDYMLPRVSLTKLDSSEKGRITVESTACADIMKGSKLSAGPPPPDSDHAALEEPRRMSL